MTTLFDKSVFGNFLIAFSIAIFNNGDFKNIGAIPDKLQIHPQFQHHHKQMKTNKLLVMHKIHFKSTYKILFLVKPLIWTKNKQILKLTDRTLKRQICSN